jgi:hypothetical protein
MCKFKLGGYLVGVCLSLGACAPYYHWTNQDYAFSADAKEGLLIMSVTLAPNADVYGRNYLQLGIEDLTPPESIRQVYDRGYLGLVRSGTKPERFGLDAAPFGGRTRDDIVIAKLPAGKYAINYISIHQGTFYQLHIFRDMKYYFEIPAAKAVYVGNFKIILEERIDKMPFEVQIQNLSSMDLPLFYETMKNIPHEAVMIDILRAKPGL